MVLTDTDSVPGVVPEAGSAVSHAAFDAVVYGSAAPVLPSATVCVPAAVNVMLAGESVSTGAAVTVSVTDAVWEVAPGALSVMSPV